MLNQLTNANARQTTSILARDAFRKRNATQISNTTSRRLTSVFAKMATTKKMKYALKITFNATVMNF